MSGGRLVYLWYSWIFGLSLFPGAGTGLSVWECVGISIVVNCRSLLNLSCVWYYIGVSVWYLLELW